MSEPTDMNLTPDERKRFAAHCLAEAYSYNGLAEQALKLPHGETFAKQLRMKATAYALVAHELDSTESQTL